MDASLLATFSTRLRETRGETMQATFAQEIGVSRASLSSYENGTRIPDIETLKRIHEATGVSVYYLLGLSDCKDDSLATTQRNTGLSEKALNHFAEYPISAKVINHFITCGAMKVFSDRAAILHDDSLLIGDFAQHEWSEIAKALRDESFYFIEKQMHSLLSAILIDDAHKSESFGTDIETLPSVKVKNLVQNTKRIYDTLDKLSETYPEAKDVKKDYAEILDKMLRHSERRP